MSGSLVALGVAAALASQARAAESQPHESQEGSHAASWDANPAESASAEVSPAEPSVPAPRVAERPSSDTSRNSGRALVGSGAALVAIGGASWVFVALPALIVRQVAMNRAERELLVNFSTKEQRYRRARRADDTMEGAFWGGAIAISVGIPLLVSGIILRNRAREDLASRLDLNASGLRVRF